MYDVLQCIHTVYIYIYSIRKFTNHQYIVHTIYIHHVQYIIICISVHVHYSFVIHRGIELYIGGLIIFACNVIKLIIHCEYFFDRGSPADKGQSDFNTNAMEALEGFVIGLYSAVFNAVVSLINRYLICTTCINRMLCSQLRM